MPSSYHFTNLFTNQRFSTLSMGLLVKLKNSQKKQWDFFIQCATESYLENKLVALPFNKAGYGFIVNPQQPSWFSTFTDLKWGIPPTQIIFLVESLEIAKEIGIFPPIAALMAQEYWPKEVILQVPIRESHPLISQIQKEISGEEFSMIFPNRTIHVMMPNNPIFTAFTQALQENHESPIFIGIYADDKANLPCIDSTRLAEIYTHPNIGMILGHGTLQKGKRPQGPTIIECLDDENINIVQEGLISTEDITAFIEKCEEEENTDDEF